MRVPTLTPWRGALLLASMAVVVAITLAASRSNLGFGVAGDVGFALGTLVFASMIAGGLGWGLLTLARRVSVWSGVALVAVGTAGAYVMGILLPHPLARLVVLVGVLLVGWLGSALTLFLLQGRDSATPRTRRVLIGAQLVLALGVTGVVTLWGVSGARSPSGTLAAEGLSRTGTLVGGNPGLPGPYGVGTLVYGSGTDRRRRAYGDGVAIRTPTLDLRPLLPGFRGWESDAHRAYWGFGLQDAPMNGRIWFPQRPDASTPVVLIIPGINPGMDEAELGYGYLGELLASRGFAVVAIDVNFLGGPRISQWAREMPVRAWLALEHLRLLQEIQGRDPEGPLGTLDFDRVALLGHSRGGEAAAIAARLNEVGRYPGDALIPVSFGFGIEAVVALAPTDGFRWSQGRGTELEGVDYLVLHGSQDSDLPAFFGAGQYQRVTIPENSSRMKGAVYLTGANHAQFNALRGSGDQPGFLAALLDRAEILSGELQRAMTGALVSAFLDASLNGNASMRPVLRDPGVLGGPGSPLTFSARFEDGWTRVVAGFEEDDDPATTTVSGGWLAGRGLATWREEALRLRDRARTPAGNTVVRLEWRADPSISGPAESPAFEVGLPDGFGASAALNPSGSLTFSAGVSTPALPRIPGIVVEVITGSGDTARVSLSDYGTLPVPRQPRIWRVPLLDRWLVPGPEVVLQSFEIPFGDFESARPGLDLEDIQRIRFVFDPGSWGSVLMDDIGFRAPAHEIAP
jgi:dienelactone hydrolase